MFEQEEDNIISLNVGGQWYATKRSTLNRFHSEALQQMLRYPDKDGNFFLDRDGKMFQYILGFFRDGKLCLPSDFSEFDSLTGEVNFFNISNLSQCLENIKQEKLKVKYLEILDTRDKGGVKIILRGKKEDLEALPFNLAPGEHHKLQIAGNSLYVEVISCDNNVRFLLAELLTVNGWTCTTSDFSSSSCGLEDVMITQHSYRDLWKK